jgi:Major Facilitator Superfamily
VVGALVFGRLTDKLGRKKLFILTLILYLAASGIAAFSFSPWFLLIWRFVAGLGIGGEYTAINSAIDELIPSYYRGRVDIAVNGTYWAGAMIGAAASIFLLNPHIFPVNVGWRVGLLIGPVIGLIIIYLRRTIPESPLQRHLLHVRARPRALLQHPRRQDRLLLLPVRRRQPARPDPPRPALRHRRAAQDDLWDVRHLRRAPRHQRRPFPRRRADRGDADDLLVRHLLLRLGRGVLGVPDRQRDLPPRAARAGHLVLLRDLPARRWRRAAPYIFGRLIGEGKNPGPLTIGYYVGAAVMILGGVIAWFFGVDAERRSLEDIANPLSAVTPREELPDRTRGRGGGPRCGATRFEGPTPTT